MNVVLCGYHWVGCKALDILVRDGHNVIVFTHECPWHVPDLRAYAAAMGVPSSCENASDARLPFEPDIICSIYYRHIFKPDFVDRYRGRIVNLHPSLLPMYRGCSSLTWAMIEGRDEAGFTYHYVDEGCDTGDVLLQERIRIEAFDTQETLYLRVMFRAMNAFRNVVDMVARGVPGTKQVGASSYYRRGCPFDGELQLEWPEDMKRRFIRAMTYPPLPPARLAGKPVLTPADLPQKSSG